MTRGPRLQGKVALVTGAARGMGAATAARFVDEGARMVLADVLDDDLAATGAAIEARAPGTTVALHLDVNLTGPFLGMRAAIPTITGTIARQREAGDVDATGSIVNLSPAQAFRPSSGNAAYASSKWGLRGLTKVVALDAAPMVRVKLGRPR